MKRYEKKHIIDEGLFIVTPKISGLSKDEHPDMEGETDELKLATQQAKDFIKKIKKKYPDKKGVVEISKDKKVVKSVEF